MAAYTTAEIDAKIRQLEGAIGGTAEIDFQGRKMVYRTMAEIRSGIAYFRGLYPSASDATVTQKTRTFYLFGSNGF